MKIILMNPEAVLAHIRANADAVAHLSINAELTGTAVCEFCTWAEALLKPQAPGYAAGGHAAVTSEPEVKKEKVVGDHNLHSPRR